MKSFTDLEQSRKLAEILPLESADMCYIKGKAHLGFLYEEYKEVGDTVLQDYEPCWSLTALLSVIPKRIKEDYIFRIDVGVKDSSIWYDELRYGVKNDLPDITAYNLVDACYEMIVKLHEKNELVI
jgi:hypothetical protein